MTGCGRSVPAERAVEVRRRACENVRCAEQWLSAANFLRKREARPRQRGSYTPPGGGQRWVDLRVHESQPHNQSWGRALQRVQEKQDAGWRPKQAARNPGSEPRHHARVCATGDRSDQSGTQRFADAILPPPEVCEPLDAYCGLPDPSSPSAYRRVE